MKPSRLISAIVRFPDRLQVVFLAGLISAGTAASLGVHTPWTVIPIFIAALVALWRFTPRPPASSRAHVFGATASTGVALAFLLANLAFASQQLWVTRDPGIYTVVGIWLTQHPSVLIDTSGAAALTQALHGASASLGAFGGDSGGLALQGGVLLPAVLAIGGWVFGIKGVLAMNLAVAAVALIAVYGLARRFLGPILALVPQLALALSLAFIFLSRSTYSEILMTAVCAAGVIWLVAGLSEQRASLFAVAGVMLGMSGFARIDGALGALGVLAALIVAMFIADESWHRILTRGGALFLLTSTAALGAGVLSLWVNQRGYLDDLIQQARLLWIAYAGVALLWVLATAVRRRVPQIPGRARHVAGIVAASAGGLAFAVLASRPLWFEAHFTQGEAYIQTIGNIQAMNGLPVDGTRSYDEHTVSWIAWYFGWPTAALIGFGITWALYVAFRRRDIGLLVLLGTTLTAAALYLNRVSITPDQVWAYRRLMPLITPGFLVLALVPLTRMLARGGWKRSAGAVIACAVAFAPLLTWNSLLGVAEQGGQLAMAQSICTGIGEQNGKPVVLITDGAPPNYAVTLRTVCDVQVISVQSAVLEPDLARELGGHRFIAFSDQTGIGLDGIPAHGAGSSVQWAPSLMSLPDQTVRSAWTYWIGEFADDGSRIPISSSPASR